jgi:hypothetical protein|tara:strand:- start:13 stop:249 length:237 start_codon:yes stop_codon:yes gene_type:complete
MKLKDLLNINKQPAKYIDTPDGAVKICEQGPLPKTNFIVGPFTNAKASDRIPGYDKVQFYKDYITRLLPDLMIKKELP